MIQYLFPIRQMKRNLSVSRQRLDQMRLGLLKKQIENANENVPFYQKAFRSRGLLPDNIATIADLGKFPIISKKHIQQNPEAFLNARLPKKRCFASHTSGSTGEPSWTYYDRPCWYRKKYLSKLRARMACGLNWGERIAIFESEASARLRKQTRRLPFQRLIFQVSYFSLFEEVKMTLPLVIEFNPQNIYGPPSYLFQLARAFEEEQKHLPGLKRIFTSAEYLEAPVKRFLSHVFQANVFDIFGSTEMKEVAWECEHGKGYHINEDEVICEVLDKSGKNLSPGEVGDIVMTDLHNKAMPLIRFWTADKGMLLENPCACGRTFSLMKPLAGRASEYIQLPNGKHLSPYLFTTSIEKIDGLLQYQIIQKSDVDLFVKVIFDDAKCREGRREIERILSRITENTMEITIEQCATIDIEETGKYKVVKNVMNEALHEGL